MLASGSGSNFEAIVDAAREGGLEIAVRALVCNNASARCLERAERLGIDANVIDHRSFEERATFDAAVRDHLRDRRIEWVVMAGWMRIATRTLIDAFRGRILNLHPSLLPAFPGATAVEDALEEGVRMTGCTVHVVTEDLDGGPIVAQAAVPVRDVDDTDRLHDRIHEAEHWLFPRAIARAIAEFRAGDLEEGGTSSS